MMTRRDSIVLSSVCLVAGAAFAAATPAQAGMLFFTDQASFDAAVADAGKILKGVENFPWLARPDDAIALIACMVDTNSDIPGWVEPGMLLDNVTYYANHGGADSSELSPNPDGSIALFTQGFLGATSNGINANAFIHAFDIVSGPPAGDNHTAMSMHVATFLGGDTVRVHVYDKNNVFLGAITDVPAPVAGGGFLGILTTGGDILGRVNIFDPLGGVEAVYDVSVHVQPGDFDGDFDVVRQTDPCFIPIFGDLNLDGAVDTTDLLILLASWGECPPPPGVCLGDLNFDGLVNVSDLLLLLVAWS